MARDLLKHVPSTSMHRGLVYELQRMVWTSRSLCGRWFCCPWDFDPDDYGIKRELTRWVLQPGQPLTDPGVGGGPSTTTAVELDDLDVTEITCLKCRNVVLGRLYEAGKLTFPAQQATPVP